jgi:molybdopterin molybdotransferase
VPVTKRLKRGEVFDSNRPTILAMIADTGAIPVNLGTVSDKPALLEQRIEKHADGLDVLVTIGGVSAGDFDIVKQLIVAYRDMALVRVAMRPAKPQAFGHIGKLLWYGLPGNPVSAMVAFDRFVRPLVLRAMGHREIFRVLRHGTCTTSLRKMHSMREFVRVHAWSDSNGWKVDLVGPAGSSNLRNMVNANAFAILHENAGSVLRGKKIEFELFDDALTRRVE